MLGPKSGTERTLLDTKGAADYLGIARQTMSRYRVEGTGPRFVKAGGRVLYRREAIDAWLLARERASTSDNAA